MLVGLHPFIYVINQETASHEAFTGSAKEKDLAGSTPILLYFI